MVDIPDARKSSDAIDAGTDTGVAFTKVVVDALSTSVGNKTKSATISISGKSGADVMRTIQELKQKGYKVSSSGSTLTVTW